MWSSGSPLAAVADQLRGLDLHVLFRNTSLGCVSRVVIVINSLKLLQYALFSQHFLSALLVFEPLKSCPRKEPSLLLYGAAEQ